ncbi:membrane protein [Labrenzia sp. C1B10]|uniref:hypothetical protein n=1 Tax=unclassified Labrenzia TaxID=2648686 RepID=UPI0003B8BA4D|nr:MULTISPECIES: hypothetical protein [unclassified Labrenzia]ERP95651.1 membrane protein [Labrenzia sp. C1B10]ERS05717.1 membrane protein [Labrenzia sp. C1B70]
MWVQLILGLALMIIGYILQPKPKAQKPAAATDLEGPTAEAGRPVPVPFGDITMVGGNYLWHGDKEMRKRTERVGGKK